MGLRILLSVRLLGRVAAGAILALVLACGGGGGGSSASGGGGNPPTTTFTVTAVAGTGTTITPASMTVQSGQTASFTVGLQAGYSNLVVTGGGGALSGNTYTTGPITANTTVTASATANPTTYTVTAVAGAGTTITPASLTVQSGQTASFTVGLQAGYSNLVVTGGGGTLSGNTYTTGPITANTTVTASATRSQFKVQASIQGAGGTISPSEVMVAPGGNALFTLTLNPGFKFKGMTWKWGVFGSYLSPDLVVASNVQDDSAFAVVVEPISEITDRYIPEDLHISQNAIFADEFTTTQVKLTLHSKYATLNHLTITAESNPNYPPENTVLATFYDDGTHGDDVAGDGTFTALYTPSSLPPAQNSSYYGGKLGFQSIFPVARDTSGNEVRSADLINYCLFLGAIDRSLAVPLTPAAAGEFSTTNLVNFVWPGINNPYRWDRASVTRRLLSKYGDNFDFLTVRFAGILAPNEGWQNFVTAGNQVQGIGRPLFSTESFVWGSNGTLRGVLQMGAGGPLIALNHEIGHFACYFLDDAQLRLSTGEGHINTPSTMLGVDSYGPWLLEQPSGDYLIGWNPNARTTYCDPYSRLELYLMGLIEPAEVTAERFLLDPAVPRTLGTLVPKGKTTLVTADDLIRVYGPRVPDAAVAPKQFRMAWVVLSDRPLTPAEVALEHLAATWAESRPEGATALQLPATFHWATGGRGSLTTTLPPRIP